MYYVGRFLLFVKVEMGLEVAESAADAVKCPAIASLSNLPVLLLIHRNYTNLWLITGQTMNSLL